MRGDGGDPALSTRLSAPHQARRARYEATRDLGGLAAALRAAHAAVEATGGPSAARAGQ